MLHPRYAQFIGVCLLVVALVAHSSAERFSEELLIHPLPNQLTVTHFQFSVDWNRDPNGNNNHFNLFPKSMGKLLDEFGVEEMRLSFTRGRWEYTKWGQPPLSAPQGAELWAYFKSEKAHQVDNTWKEFTHALSGLFCASLTYMYSPYQNSPNISRPVVPFRPQTHTFPSSKAFPASIPSKMSTLPMRHGILQGESICTENLTPWSKQLPCRVQAGLGKLLAKVPPLLDSHYSSVALHFRPIEIGSKYELIATLTLVSPADESRKFSLSKAFPSAESLTACPLAASSKVFIHEDPSTHTIESSEPLTRSAAKSSLAVLDLKKLAESGSKGAIVSAKFTQVDPAAKLKSVEWIDVRRWTAGWGLQRGQLAILISNKLNSTIDSTLHQVIPWLMRLYFHTIKFTRDGKLMTQEEVNKIAHVFALPSQDRVRPSVLEIDLKLAPQSQLLITVDYENNFLHWTEHPPDAHRGFDISAATLTVRLSERQKQELSVFASNEGVIMSTDELDWSIGSKGSSVIRLYTDGLLLMLPTPDFSMPYNVITLSSTIWALFFGSIVNMMLRRYKEVYAGGKEFRDDRPIVKIIRKILSLVQRKKKQD